MVSLVLLLLAASAEITGAIAGLAAAVLLLILVIVASLRECRNSALENFVVENELPLPAVFHGTLAIEQHSPGSYLRLRMSTTPARRLQFRYRWLEGIGPQAIYDEVAFDRPQATVALRRKDKARIANFQEFSAIRLREVAGRSLVSLWHLELVPRKGRPEPFISSARGDRQAMFEHIAPIAKSVSAIMGVPVQVVVAGNVWTPGWPPKQHGTPI